MYSRVLSVAAVALLGMGLLASVPALADNTPPQSVDVTAAPPADSNVTLPATPDTPDASATDAAPAGDSAKDDGKDEDGDAKDAPASEPAGE